MTLDFAANSARRPTVADYGGDYFAALYGAVPRQTAIDIARDRLIHRLVGRYVEGGRLLEIGCGFGYLLRRFERSMPGCWRLHGTDISPHAAAVAQRRLPHGHVVAADIQQGIPFQGLFDALIAVNVLEHLPQPHVAAQAIAGAVRPGAVVVAHLPTINNAVSRWIYAHSYERDPTHVYRPSVSAFNHLFEQAGFRTLDSLPCPFWPGPVWRLLKPHPAYLAVFERL